MQPLFKVTYKGLKHSSVYDIISLKLIYDTEKYSNYKNSIILVYVVKNQIYHQPMLFTANNKYYVVSF